MNGSGHHTPTVIIFPHCIQQFFNFHSHNLHQINMFGDHYSTTSFPMPDGTGKVFIIGKNYLSPSHCPIGTLVKGSQSTHNIFPLFGCDLQINEKLFSFSSYIISKPANNVKSFFTFFSFLWHPRWFISKCLLNIKTCRTSTGRCGSWIFKSRSRCR